MTNSRYNLATPLFVTASLATVVALFDVSWAFLAFKKVAVAAFFVVFLHHVYVARDVSDDWVSWVSVIILIIQPVHLDDKVLWRAVDLSTLFLLWLAYRRLVPVVNYAEVPEEFYLRAVDELAGASETKGLYAKLLIEFHGDEQKAKAVFLRRRAQDLYDEAVKQEAMRVQRAFVQHQENERRERVRQEKIRSQKYNQALSDLEGARKSLHKYGKVDGSIYFYFTVVLLFYWWRDVELAVSSSDLAWVLALISAWIGIMVGVWGALSTVKLMTSGSSSVRSAKQSLRVLKDDFDDIVSGTVLRKMFPMPVFVRRSLIAALFFSPAYVVLVSEDHLRTALAAELAADSLDEGHAIRVARMLLSHNDPNAAWVLYQLSDDSMPSSERLSFLNSAANGRLGYAKAELGRVYFEGEIVQRDLTFALHNLEEAVRLGASEAALPAAVIMVTEDLTGNLPLRHYLGIAAETGDEWAQRVWALDTLAGEATSNERSQACSMLDAVADSLEGADGLLLGRCYRDGVGVELDSRKAGSWLRRAAESGNARAWLEYGRLLVEDHPVTEEFVEEARAAYERARALETGEAEYALAQLELSAESDKGRFARGVEYLSKSAYFGYGPAQREIGLLYERDKLTSKAGGNLDQAKKWYRYAASNGDDEALVALGRVSERTGDLLVAYAAYKLAQKNGAADSTYVASFVQRLSDLEIEKGDAIAQTDIRSWGGATPERIQ